MKALIATTSLLVQFLSASQKTEAQQPGLSGQRLNAGVSLASHHFKQRSFETADGTMRHYNEFNPGVSLEFRLSNTFHISAGIYKNSIYRLTSFMLAGAETNRERFVGVGAEAGVATGYFVPVLPSGEAYLRLGRQDQWLNFKIGLIPPIKDVTPAVMTLQMRVNLGSHKPTYYSCPRW